jgi:RNA polymerase sigma-70 factor, ECF subfamily
MREFARLHDALACLPDRYQTVLALRYFETMPCAEIADVLGEKIGTVKSLIHRGLERLRRQFEKHGTSSPQSLPQ